MLGNFVSVDVSFFMSKVGPHYFQLCFLCMAEYLLVPLPLLHWPLLWEVYLFSFSSHMSANETKRLCNGLNERYFPDVSNGLKFS